MRIGTIAQHANVGPTGFRSIVDVLPGRLNDYPLSLWYDFTDNSTVSGYLGAGTADVANLPTITDKGPNNVEANAQSFGPDTKGPSWFYINDLEGVGTTSAQNFHNYAQGGLGADIMGFSNPTDLYTRAFTMVIVFDTTAESDGGTAFGL